MKIRFLLLIAVMALLVIASGLARAQGNKGFVRVLEVSPDAPSVDFFVDDMITAWGRDLKFGDEVPFAELAAGDHRIQVGEYGAPADAIPLASGNFTLKPGAFLTLLGYGLAKGDAATPFGILTWVSNDVPAGQAMLEVLNVAPDRGAITVTETTSKATLDVAYKEADPAVIPPSTYEFTFAASDAKDTPLLTVSGVEAKPDEIITLVISDKGPDSGNKLQVTILYAQKITKDGKLALVEPTQSATPAR